MLIGCKNNHNFIKLLNWFSQIPLSRLSPVLFPQRLATELVLIDVNENLASAQAEDIRHAGAFLGNPKIIGTKGEQWTGLLGSNCEVWMKP